MTLDQNNNSAFAAWWPKYTLFAVSALAVCVSLGTATVSLAKLLVLVGVLGQLMIDGLQVRRFQWSQAPKVYGAILLALGWMLLSMLWSEADLSDQWKYFYAHARLLWVLAFVYLLKDQLRAMKALKWLVLGQLFVVGLSWLMWTGVPVPFTKPPIEKAIAFTSSLEQPVMSSLLLVLLWSFRGHWSRAWGRWTVSLLMLLVLANISFAMTGRTGYLVLFVFLAMELFRGVPRKMAWVALVVPLLFALGLYEVSPRFAERVGQVKTNSLAYQGQDVTTSEGQRIDMWYRALLGIEKKPILGYGVGSYPQVYRAEGGLIQGVVSQPHQQYLLWWIDAGLVGLLLLFSFFAALLYDARQLQPSAAAALVTTTAIAFVMGMMNCPLFGVGMGEYFLLIMAALLLFRKPQP